jgi:hypothetical protein
VELSGVRVAGVADELSRRGFANLGPFLDEEALVRARAAFDDVATELGPLGDRWFPTILLQDAGLRERITTTLESLIAPRLADVLDPGSWDLLRVDYSVKPASPDSELGPHQDFSLVDERVATSLYLWIPLVDTDEANGTLHVLAGSHRFANRIRSQHVPAYFDEVLDIVRDEADRLDCRAGDLVLMVSGVIHFSPPNRSDEVRLVAHGIATPRGVPLAFYYADERTDEGLVECYEVDLETYVRHIHRGRPGEEVPLARREPRPPAHMTRGRLLAGLAAARAQG